MNNSNVEKSAFETFTGQWAKKNGFTKVDYEKRNVSRDKVIVKFLK